MSLRVWLPLIENTNNQGISPLNTFSYNTLTQQTDGKLGKCYLGQGIYHLENDFLSNEWSLCAWVKSASWSQYNDIILCKNTSASDNCQFYFSIINGATLNFAVNGGSSGLTFNYAFATNTWYHVAATYNGSEYALYINGEQKKKQAVSTTAKTGMNNLGINCRSTNTAGTSQTGDGGKKLNDVRIYDHCLSAAEVREIAQGLVLHYKLDGGLFGNSNLLAKYVVPGQAAPTSTANGGRTTWLGDYKITIPATENADTYFRLFMTEQLISGTTYTISCKVSGLLDGSYYRFPLFAQSNTSMGVLTLDHNGLCSLTFTMNWTGTQTAATGANGETVYVNFLDDSARSLASGQGPITLYDFKLEKGDAVTMWCPADNELDIDRTIIEDSSGYNHNGICVDTVISSDSPRYNNCISCIGATVDSSSNTITGAQYFYCNMDMPAAKAITIAWWNKITKYGRGGIFETSNSIQTNTTKGADYNTTAFANWDTTFGVYNGSTRVNIFSNFARDGEWHHHAITFDGVNVKYYLDSVLKQTSALTGNLPAWKSFCIGLGKAGGVWRQIQQNVSDFRIYCTPLLDTDIKQLYNVGMKVDKLGNVHTNEFVEKDKGNGENTQVTIISQDNYITGPEVTQTTTYKTQTYNYSSQTRTYTTSMKFTSPGTYIFSWPKITNSSFYKTMRINNVNYYVVTKHLYLRLLIFNNNGTQIKSIPLASVKGVSSSTDPTYIPAYTTLNAGSKTINLPEDDTDANDFYSAQFQIEYISTKSVNISEGDFSVETSAPIPITPQLFKSGQFNNRIINEINFNDSHAQIMKDGMILSRNFIEK